MNIILKITAITLAVITGAVGLTGCTKAEKAEHLIRVGVCAGLGDLALMSYYIAKKKEVSTPLMVNLDGFNLTHTSETVDIPTVEQADEFLPSS
ncbi:MAG: hypothetical protein Q4F95_09815 [Oscillospiraceae bacterium]|nr:hypothetical protein [Oscillospiraceae bacterium]